MKTQKLDSINWNKAIPALTVAVLIILAVVYCTVGF